MYLKLIVALGKLLLLWWINRAVVAVVVAHAVLTVDLHHSNETDMLLKRKILILQDKLFAVDH